MSSALVLAISNIIGFQEYMIHLFMMTTAWMIGLCAGYIIELFSRKNYEKKELSVIMLDIDKFKNINDTYGHATGDIVIKSLANLLKGNNKR